MPSFTKALPRLGGALVPKPASSVTESGKSDLLMRFFESEWFDTWIALTYLYKSSSPGVQDYLCNRLYTLPEREVEKYLSQLTQLCMIRPNSSLERVIIDLCSRSLRIAIKTYWLLLAISQDNPHDLHVIALRDRCEQAALEGTWDLPFKDSRLPPLRISPSFVDMGLASPPRSPRGTLSVLSSTPSHVPSLLGAGERWGSPDRDAPGDTLSRAASPDCASPRPMSPDGFGSGVYSSVFMDTGVEGLLGYSAPQGAEAQGAQAWLERTPASPGASGTSPDPASALSPPNSPRRRQTTFGATLDFIDALCTASSGLTAFPPEDREWALRQVLASINVQIEAASRKGVAVWFPMGTRARRVVRLAPRESNLLNSREKAPFTLYVEVLDEEVAAAEGGEGAGVGGEKLGCGPARNAGEPTPSRPPALQRMSSEPEDSLTGPGDEGSDSGGSSSAAALMAVRASSGTYLGAQLFGPARSEDAAGVDGAVEGEPSTAAPPPHPADLGTGLDRALAGLRGDAPLVRLHLDVLDDDPAPGSEDEDERGPSVLSSTASSLEGGCVAERSSASPAPGPLRCLRPAFGPSALLRVARKHRLPPPVDAAADPASLASVPEQHCVRTSNGDGGVGGGPDAVSPRSRSASDPTELLAMQLIDAFHDIFREARLPLTLHPYEVLVTSNRTALIELVPNAPSVHAVKGACPPGTSLRDHFLERYGAGTPELLAAQRNFVESMAAYSLVSYFLQIKDRHNGNILLDDAGHIVHIDFGFMLTNSPGGVNFESVPFKLTRELLEVMDSGPSGQASELFDYFKVLMIQGFLAVRRHADRILLLVEMMSSSACPCFKSRAAAVGGLRKRFALALPEPALVEMVLGLISDSLDAWRTRQYDYYQRVLNGVL
ncbi:Phosphatidylinositol 4-kinase beta 1 [Auxenochlorella protothecoides]|uniref:1-phosphatidylinositol 4-kinase n=1 Tax=Auxenochlorella protothecoides TaxID=3075 RepID=A0A087STK2_AUXPR|nr:Phosphatidylinositol 4-kinase beta 1 [Auxenochlorella protothecoides]KFM29056.1 Phosphatidylinositol 4-kinase beta 1 [Auxenochlorella protothecoides]